MAGKKAVSQVRRQTAQKRGGVELRGESIVADRLTPDAAPGFDQFDAGDPTPEFLAHVEEQQQLLFGKLRNDVLREIARLRITGYTHGEIAEKVGISVRSVERKLSLIRDTWTAVLEEAEE